VHVDVCAEGAEVVEEVVDLLLERRYMRRHLLELVRFFEVVTAIRRILAVEVEVSAPLTGCLAIALDLAPLTLVTGICQLSYYHNETKRSYQAMEIYLLRFARLLCAVSDMVHMRSYMTVTYGCAGPSSLFRLLLESSRGLIVSLALFLSVALMINSALRAFVPLRVTKVGTALVYKGRQDTGVVGLCTRGRTWLSSLGYDSSNSRSIDMFFFV
jgi:hypothetical protein